ncbi:MFS transporter [Cryptosporangium aurantiacum]|uniref:MFS transporter, DHA1 family, inner membrane transport protein n=1 Tax=Cryptosporangium aurantiacum TaxID=134849 RepID=A0A1M7NQE1_9ACTN|nr:MFS transporter [Cryptosporangium aurantiacum]SHN06209.1 MFS transporter, DHA1 family, inner membrane transport protein [Cryptosporangium aurantiacum]
MAKALGALIALSLSTFTYVTVETLPIGLLPLIADDLGVSPSAVGMLVTGYGLVVVAASIPLTALTRRWPRKAVLIGLLVILVVTTLASALAGVYWVLLAARLLTALSQALFWSIVTPIAAPLFPARMQGRAMAVLSGGSSLAAVLGVPVGTWLGQQAGWQAAFLAASVLSLVLLASVAALVPSAPTGAASAARATSPDAGRFWALMVALTLAATGAFSAFTYISTYLTDVNGFASDAIGPLLFVRGIAGVVGVVLVGLLVDRNAWATMVGVVVLQVVALTLHYYSGDAQGVAIVSIALAGAALAGLAAVLGARILHLAPRGIDMASAATSTAFNVGITAGALVGGVLLPAFGVRSTVLAGGLMSLVALAVVLAEPLLATARRRGSAPGTAVEEGLDRTGVRTGV